MNRRKGNQGRDARRPRMISKLRPLFLTALLLLPSVLFAQSGNVARNVTPILNDYYLGAYTTVANEIARGIIGLDGSNVVRIDLGNGGTRFGGDVTIDGATTLTGGVTFSGNVTITGTLGVTGATTLSSTLAVTGVSTFSVATTAATPAVVGRGFTTTGLYWTNDDSTPTLNIATNGTRSGKFQNSGL